MVIEIDGARERANLSVSELAQKMEMPPKQVKDILEGLEEISLETFIKFGLVCKTHWILRPLRVQSKKNAQ